MRVIQISDLHIVADPSATVFGVDTNWTLEKVLSSIADLDSQPDLIIVTGDLVDGENALSYQRLRKALKSAS